MGVDSKYFKNSASFQSESPNDCGCGFLLCPRYICARWNPGQNLDKMQRQRPIENPVGDQHLILHVPLIW